MHLNLLFREEILPKLIQRKFPILFDNGTSMSVAVPASKNFVLSFCKTFCIISIRIKSKHLPIFPLCAIPGCCAPLEFVPERG